MNDKTFENYQKRMLDAMQNQNEQSNDPFTKLSNFHLNTSILIKIFGLFLLLLCDITHLHILYQFLYNISFVISSKLYFVKFQIF